MDPKESKDWEDATVEYVEDEDECEQCQIPLEDALGEEPIEEPAEPSEAIEGEVIGYDLRAVHQRMMEEVDACHAQHLMSEMTVFIIKNVVTAWANQLLAQGADTINVHTN
jgi:hypothetical protein